MHASTSHTCRHARWTAAKLWAVTGVAACGVAATAGGVYAALNASASNAAAEQVSSGTLKLILGDHGSGFSQQLTNIAPADVVNRYVNLSSTGTLAGRNLTLGVSDATPSVLTTDATRGLQVTVSSCAGADWDPTTGVCGTGGTVTRLINAAPLSTLASSPASVTGTAVAAGSQLHLQLSVTLPDQVETTVNGVLPANTIQGLSANLTWTFVMTQRSGVTTTS